MVYPDDSPNQKKKVLKNRAIAGWRVGQSRQASECVPWLTFKCLLTTPPVLSFLLNMRSLLGFGYAMDMRNSGTTIRQRWMAKINPLAAGLQGVT